MFIQPVPLNEWPHVTREEWPYWWDPQVPVTYWCDHQVHVTRNKRFKKDPSLTSPRELLKPKELLNLADQCISDENFLEALRWLDLMIDRAGDLDTIFAQHQYWQHEKKKRVEEMILFLHGLHDRIDRGAEMVTLKMVKEFLVNVEKSVCVDSKTACNLFKRTLERVAHQIAENEEISQFVRCVWQVWSLDKGTARVFFKMLLQRLLETDCQMGTRTTLKMLSIFWEQEEDNFASVLRILSELVSGDIKKIEALEELRSAAVQLTKSIQCPALLEVQRETVSEHLSRFESPKFEHVVLAALTQTFGVSLQTHESEWIKSGTSSSTQDGSESTQSFIGFHSESKSNYSLLSTEDRNLPEPMLPLPQDMDKSLKKVFKDSVFYTSERGDLLSRAVTMLDDRARKSRMEEQLFQWLSFFLPTGFLTIPELEAFTAVNWYLFRKRRHDAYYKRFMWKGIHDAMQAQLNHYSNTNTFMDIVRDKLKSYNDMDFCKGFLEVLVAQLDLGTLMRIWPPPTKENTRRKTKVEIAELPATITEREDFRKVLQLFPFLVCVGPMRDRSLMRRLIANFNNTELKELARKVAKLTGLRVPIR